MREAMSVAAVAWGLVLGAAGGWGAWRERVRGELDWPELAAVMVVLAVGGALAGWGVAVLA
jgi:hypothetical protein